MAVGDQIGDEVMISLKRRYKTARARIAELQKCSPSDEEFVLTVFFVEKLIRRTLLQLVIWKGMTFSDALKVVEAMNGVWKVKNAWPCYDPKNRILENIIGKPNWDIIADAGAKRNRLVHGSGNEGQRVYSKALSPLIAALDEIKEKFAAEYKYYGWRGMKDIAGNRVLSY
jgi:hypothetical protein